ncbi:hypothetical protein P3T20_001205 [Paraburkholderia sp. GAS206C]|uniref:hypothetical protein n=1 Tax=unclassified Paraburkholderia TaxID=2615204 RepID=UPI003D19D5BD
MPLKILVGHSSEKVGTTTVVDELLVPRLGTGVEVLRVDARKERAEGDGDPARRFGASDPVPVIDALLSAKNNVIVEVAATQFSAFVEGLRSHPQAVPLFDAIIVPLTPDVHVQQETIVLVKNFTSLGVPPGKLRILFNMVRAEPGASLEKCVGNQFPQFLRFARAHGVNVRMDAALWETPVYSQLAAHGLKLRQVLADKRDYEPHVQAAIHERRLEKIEAVSMTGEPMELLNALRHYLLESAERTVDEVNALAQRFDQLVTGQRKSQYSAIAGDVALGQELSQRHKSGRRIEEIAASIEAIRRDIDDMKGAL